MSIVWIPFVCSTFDCVRVCVLGVNNVPRGSSSLPMEETGRIRHDTSQRDAASESHRLDRKTCPIHERSVHPTAMTIPFPHAT